MREILESIFGERTIEEVTAQAEAAAGTEPVLGVMLAVLVKRAMDQAKKSKHPANFGRPVVIHDFDRDTKEPYETRGRFQFFGNRFNFRDRCQETVVIVELEDGHMTARPPHMVQFTDAQQSD